MALPQPAARFEREDFFAWDAEQPMKHDYVAGEVFAQGGARQDHVVVALNIATSLRQKLRGTPGTSQDSCRLIHATNRPMSSALTCSRTTASRSGLSVTAPTGVQSRVPRDQRAGWRSRAWRYV